MSGQRDHGGRVRVALGDAGLDVDAVRRAVGPRYELCAGDAPARIRLLGPGDVAGDGTRALQRHRLGAPETPCVVVVDDAAPRELVCALFRAGAADVVTAGALAHELPAALDRALRTTGARLAPGASEARLAAELGKRARELESALEALRQSYDATLAALVGALDLRERETANHSQRVAVYSVLLGLRAHVPDDTLEDLYRGALLHDIGKLGIPDAVLLKPGSFNEDEWVEMRRHTELGGEILRHISFLSSAADVPRAHHEAWDGSGYPAGLAGEAIPLHARIFAVVDSYDAIRSERPYKPAIAHAEALERLRSAAGSRLDPELVELFAREPEASWQALEARVRDLLSFAQVLDACRRVALGATPAAETPA